MARLFSLSKEFEEYMADNWMNILDQWALFAMDNVTRFGLLTNNPLEGMHREHKEYLSPRCLAADVVRIMVMRISHLVKTYNTEERFQLLTVRPIVGSQTDVDELMQCFGAYAARTMSDEIRTQVPTQYVCNLTSRTCSCPFFRNWMLPCRHLRDAARRELVPLTDLAISNRWVD